MREVIAEVEVSSVNGSKPAVVLVHGWWNSGKIFRSMKRKLEESGYEVFVPNLKPSDARNGIEPLSKKLKLFIEEEVDSNREIALVGFSMGGLISRYYTQELGGHERVVKLFTLASPHRGTLMGWCWWGKGARQMRIGSDFVQMLKDGESKLDGIHVEAWWTPVDTMIVPSFSADWQGQETHCVFVAAHMLIPYSTRVIRGVERALAE